MRRDHIISAVVSGVLVVLGAGAVAAFEGPGCAPPGCNVPGPVWLQGLSPAQQSGSFYISGRSKVGNVPNGLNDGDIGLSNDLYFASTAKSIRVDGNGATALRIGNYDPLSNDTFTLSVVTGNPYSEVIQFTATETSTSTRGRICLNGSCISSWPSGSGAGDLTDVLAGTGISVVNGSGPQPTVSADYTTVQARVSGQCDAGSSIRIINANGTVTCEGTSGGSFKKFRYGSAGGLATPAGTQPINVPAGGDTVNDGNWTKGSGATGPITYIGSAPVVVRAVARMNCPGDGYPPMFKNGQAPSQLGGQYFSLQNGDSLWPYKTAAAAQTCSNVVITIQEVEGLGNPPETASIELYGTRKFQYGSAENVSTPAGTRPINIAASGDVINDGNWTKGSGATGPITYVGSSTAVVKATAYMTCGGGSVAQPMFKNSQAPSLLGGQYFSLQNGDSLWPYKTAAAAQTCGNIVIVIQEMRSILFP